MEHLTLKAATTQVTDQGVFEAVISTETPDREQDVVSAKAMVDALKKWNRPVPLAWNHSSEAEDIIGTVEPMTATVKNAEVIVQGQVDLESAVGKEAWRSFKSRTIGFSFGYMTLASSKREGGGRNLTEVDIFEITATPTPMNNETRVLSTKGKVEVDVAVTPPEQPEPPPEPTLDEKALDVLAALDDVSEDVMDRLAQAVKAGIEDASDEEPPEAKSEAQGPLRTDPDRLAFELATSDIEVQPPKVEEKRAPMSELPLADERRRAYDLMLESLIGQENV